jgi:oligosaccharyltransferase complex subunit gamma
MKLSFLGILLSVLFSQLTFGALTSDELFELQAAQGSRGAIYLNPSNVGSILNGPRDYYLSLLFTYTDPKASVHCEFCSKFQPNYDRVAESYHQSNPGKDAIFFLIAEYGDCSELFSKLNMTTVPRLWVFPPNSTDAADVLSPHYPFTIDRTALDDVLHFGNFISKITGANIIVSGPFDPTTFATYFAVTFVSVLVLKKKVLSRLKREKVLKNLTTLLTVILTSGYMFTVIRGIPLIAKNEKDEVMYFSGGTHWQFGLETFIISGIYLTLVAFMYALIVTIPKIENDKKRNVLVICTAFGVFYVFNYLTAIFTIKDPSYPYKLSNWL